jgi:formylglycine-generating enzyme required for sulfatase activity
MAQRSNLARTGTHPWCFALLSLPLLGITLAHCGTSTPPAESAQASACPSGMVPIAARPKEDEWKHAAFCLDETEVSVPAYAACVQSGKCTRPDTDEGCNFGKADKADHPINCVTRKQAVEYCTSVGKRVPTHGELASTEHDAQEAMFHGKELPWDEICENTSPSVGGHDDVKPRRTCPLRSGPRSPQGLYGIVGNVWEWTTTEDIPGDVVHFMLLSGGNAKYSMVPVFPTEFSRPDGIADVDTGIRCAR